MLTDVATAFAGLIGAGLVLMSARSLRAPQAAAGFGIPGTPIEDRSFRAWLAVKTVRDLACGLSIFVMLVVATPHLLGWFMLTLTVIPFGDTLIVLHSKGPKPVAYGVHGATALGLLTVGLLLLVA